MKKRKYLFLLLFAAVFFACSQDDPFFPDDGKPRGTLVESRTGNTISKEDAIRRVTELDASPYAKYGVTLYYLTYRSVYEGKPVNTSGLLFLPDGANDPELVAYFHGTQLPLKSFEEKQIPTYYQGQATDEDDFKEVKNTGLAWASAGYAVFMPDYIGFAMTAGVEHPYLYYKELFNANIDGVTAARAFLRERGHAPDNRLFLAGWSQGGGAALSANKLIQSWNGGKPQNERLEVVATSCLAGPYNFFRSLTDLLQDRGESDKVVYIQSWGIYAVNRFSGLKRPADQIWKVPVYDQMSSFFLGSSVPKDVYTQYFIDGVLDGTDTKMVNLFKDNSYHSGWVPSGEVFLFHGTDDDVVPPFNSADAEEGLKEAITNAGGDPGRVLRIEIPGADHESGLGVYIKRTLDKFNATR